MRTDAELVSQALVRDKEAFGALIARHEGQVYNYCRHLLKDLHEAQDATQDTFLRAYTNLHQLKRPSRFAGWLRRIAFSVCMNRLKDLRARPQAHFAAENTNCFHSPDVGADPARDAERRELTQIVLQAIDKLPPSYRDPIRMSYLQHASRADIARSLGLSDACVSTRLSQLESS